MTGSDERITLSLTHLLAPVLAAGSAVAAWRGWSRRPVSQETWSHSPLPSAEADHVE
jgi:hypothetical protein